MWPMAGAKRHNSGTSDRPIVFLSSVFREEKLGHMEDLELRRRVVSSADHLGITLKAQSVARPVLTRSRRAAIRNELIG